MNKRLFLYIDILGFTEMLKHPQDVEELYEIIDSLNIFPHPTYECIVFSDTLLIYDPREICTESEEISRAVMWLCEFAQDLLYRLISIDRHFRALLTVGEFKTEQLNNFRYFYGGALVETYHYEKNIFGTGLYMDMELVPYSNIFKTRSYDSKYHFVYLTQNLCRMSEDLVTGAEYLKMQVETGELQYLYAYDFVYLLNVHKNMVDTSLPGSVRSKYVNTWQMLKSKYSIILEILEAANFNPAVVVEVDWSDALKKVIDRSGFHG